MAELVDLQAVHTAACCVQVLYAWYPQDITAVSHHMSTASALQACVTRGGEVVCSNSVHLNSHSLGFKQGALTQITRSTSCLT